MTVYVFIVVAAPHPTAGELQLPSSAIMPHGTETVHNASLLGQCGLKL